jgi:hypothetical protein
MILKKMDSQKLKEKKRKRDTGQRVAENRTIIEEPSPRMVSHFQITLNQIAPVKSSGILGVGS